MEKDVFEVKRLTSRVNEYNHDESYIDYDHLGFFSSVENAFSFIESRIKNNCGYYNEYCIERIIVDKFDICFTYNEEQRKKQLDRTKKEGDIDG